MEGDLRLWVEGDGMMEICEKWYRSVCVLFSNVKCDNGYEVRIEEKNDEIEFYRCDYVDCWEEKID